MSRGADQRVTREPQPRELKRASSERRARVTQRTTPVRTLTLDRNVDVVVAIQELAIQMHLNDDIEI